MKQGTASELVLEDLETRIRLRLRGRVWALSVVAGKHGLVLRGRAINYYAAFRWLPS
jgi:hypothetical protein